MANTTVATTALYGTIITAIGKAKITAAILNGTKVKVTHAAVGDGGGAYYMPTEDQLALVKECWRGEIASYQVNESTPNMIDAKFIVPGEVGGFTVREAALIDEDGDTIAIWNTPDAQKIPITDGVSFPLTMVAHILVEDAAAVSFTVNSALDTVSRVELEEELEKFAAGVGQAIIKSVTIPAGAWKPAGADAIGRYIYVAEVADTDATKEHFPSMSIDIVCLDSASRAGLCPSMEALDGSLKFWSKRIPSIDLTGTVMLRSPNMSYSGPAGDADIATDEEVKDAVEDVFGEPVTPGEPVVPGDLNIATDEDVAQVLTDIFG